MSEAIENLIKIAETSGCSGELSRWSKASVWWFDNPMPNEVRIAGDADQRLRYFSSEATPHNPADEGYIDDSVAISIAFERQR